MTLVDDGRARPRRSDRPLAAGARRPGRRARPGRSCRRRGPGRPADHRRGRADVPAGWGFPADFSLPAVGRCSPTLKPGPAADAGARARTRGCARWPRIPLLHQPGEAWLYNLCSDLQGVLIARVSGSRCRSSWPSGCSSRSAWSTPASRCRADLGRFTSYYRPTRTALVAGRRPGRAMEPACRRSRPAPAAWSRRWTTGARSAGCCCAAARPPTAGRCCRRSRSGSMTTNYLTPRSSGRGGAVPGGAGLGLRWIGRRRRHRPVDGPGPLRLDRRHRYRGAHRPVQRHRRGAVHPARAEQPDRAGVMRDFWTYARPPDRLRAARASALPMRLCTFRHRSHPDGPCLTAPPVVTAGT